MPPKKKLFTLLVIYLLLSLNQINRFRLVIGDERLYSDSIQSLIHGVVDGFNHPLLGRSLLALFVKIMWIITGNDQPLYWRAGIIGFSVLTLIVFYQLSKLVLPPNLTWLALILVITDPLFFVFGRTVHLEIPALFFLLCSLYLFISYQNSGPKKYFFYSVACLGFGLASKVTPIVITGIVYVLWPLSKTHFPRKTRFLITLLLIPICYILGNLSFYFYPYNPFHKNIFTYSTALAKTFIGGKQTHSDFVLQTSPPKTWYLVPQIFQLYRVVNVDHTISSIAVTQNPFLFILSIPALTYVFLTRKTCPSAIKIIAATTTLNYVVYFLNIRETYYNYSLHINVLLTILVCYFLSHLGHLAKPIIVFGFCFSVLFFVIFYPFTIGLPVSQTYEHLIKLYSIYKYPAKDTLFCQHC